MERKPDPTEGDRDLNFYPADVAKSETLSAAQLEQYNEAGYISPVDVFSSAEAHDIRTYIDDLLDPLSVHQIDVILTRSTPTTWFVSDCTTSPLSHAFLPI